MSTAILISGQLRTFAKCWPTQRWHVLRHFADPHLFITVQGDGVYVPQEIIDLKEEFPGRVHVDWRTDPDLSAHLTPELTRAYHLAPYANAAPAHQLLLQHWYQNEVWKFFQSVSRRAAEPQSQSLRASAPPRETRFDTIIRLRADLWFHSMEWLLSKDTVRCIKGEPVYGMDANECFTPSWGEFGGINDRFAIMGLDAARHYFTVFDHIPELLAAGCPFHPESLVAAALERGNVDLHRTLKTFFSTERLDGTRRWPEITPMDMMHASLRAA